MGTTTTDLIPIKDGAVAARGATDAERLTEGELLYTGVVRTPVMAVAHSAPFKGRVQRIAAERFATMADVWRLTGDLPGDADPYPSRRPARKERTRERGAARPHAWARRKRGRAWRVGGARPLFRRLPDLPRSSMLPAVLPSEYALPQDAPVVGAGCGRFVAKALAERLGRPYLDFAEIIDAAPEAREMAARCAPAVAVALLAATGE